MVKQISRTNRIIKGTTSKSKVLFFPLQLNLFLLFPGLPSLVRRKHVSPHRCPVAIRWGAKLEPFSALQLNVMLPWKYTLTPVTPVTPLMTVQILASTVWCNIAACHDLRCYKMISKRLKEPGSTPNPTERRGSSAGSCPGVVALKMSDWLFGESGR